MGVYRIDEADAVRLVAELRRLGVAAEIEQYGRVIYLVVACRSEVRTRVQALAPKAVYVPSLQELSHR